MDFNGTRKPRGGASAGQVALLMLLSAVLAAAIVIGVLASGSTKYRLVDTSGDSSAALIPELVRAVKEYYYFDEKAPSSEKLVDAAAHALVNAVGDPYGAYYSEEEFEDFRDTLNGNYKGIGVLISPDEEHGVLVHRVYEGNPAEEAGILDGDYIIAVDGVSTIGMEVDEVSSRIGGEDGTTVELTVLRGEETLKFTVARGDVYVRRVYSESLGDGIGYLRIDSFTGTAASEFAAALDEQLASGIKALVIDLRDNPGGSLDVVVDIADRVLGECTVTTLEGKLVNPPKVYKSTAEKSLDIPFVVLTNGNSASASEIFASAVQDNAAGTILGTTTFGKGIVQTSWEVLPGLGYLKLTTDVYLTPNGKMIHGVGVTPDVIVDQDPELNGVDIFFVRRDMSDRDLQVKAAVELLKGKIQ